MVRNNSAQNDRKARLQNVGLGLLLAGILLLVAVPPIVLLAILHDPGTPMLPAP